MIALLCMAMVASSLAVTDTPQVIGTVVSAQGAWCDQAHQECGGKGSQSVWKMYQVQRDTRLIRVGAITGKESIVIRSRWGTLETFDCSSPRELGCTEPLDLSRLIPPQASESVVTAFFDAVLELASDHPKIYETLRQGILRTRGASGRSLSDGIVELQDEAVKLETPLKDWEAGDYLLELCPFADAPNPDCPEEPAPIPFHWDPRHPKPFAARGVHAGLYRLYLCQKDTGVPLRTQNFADLLVAAGPDYKRLADNFRKVLDATQRWDATDSTAPLLRRVYLHSLAHR